ncbi:MAG: hypothetical protein Q8K20_18915 [Gemmobacter sp.]|jgi:hypothetical protein|nr:hypothetical protein [Gemmobacter sp.]
MRALWALVVVMLWPVMAAPGPWPRDAGARFLSVSSTGDTGSVWFEQGLGRARWIVAEGRVSRAGDWDVALRYHRAMADRAGLKLAWSLGLSVGMPLTDVVIDLPPVWWPGRTEVIVRIDPVVAVQAGLSAGVGLVRPWPGWLALDLMAEAGPQRKRLKADATLGFRPRDRWMLLLQAHGRVGNGPPGLALASSIVWQVGRGTRLQAGLHHDLRGGRTVAKFGNWLEF